MSKWLSTRITTLMLFVLTSIVLLIFPISSHAVQATLMWDPNDPAPDGYCIYQRTEGQAYDYSQPCWTGYGTTGTIDGLEDNTTYYFVVRAFMGVQESADSNEVKYINGSSSPIWIEAEDADLQWPMEIADDAAASGDGYVWAPAGTGTFFIPSSSAGYAQYHFEVPETGSYVIWGRQISNDTASNSFFVSVDGQAEMAWHTQLCAPDEWTWDAVSDLYDTNPHQFQLAAGFHTLTIRQREDGTKLDTIVITNDLTTAASDLCVKLTGDVNGDGWVNIVDLAQVKVNLGKTGNPGWIPADVNSDGCVNIVDLAILKSQFGQTSCEYQ